LPVKIVGAVSEAVGGEAEVFGVNTLGDMTQLREIAQQNRPHRIAIALRERRQRLPLTELLELRMQGMIVEEASSLYEHLTGRIPVENVHPSALIFADGFRNTRPREVFSRISGFIGAILAIVVSAPVMALIAIAIKLSSQGPILYGQERTGQNGKPFKCWKFRSMRADAEKLSGPVWAQARDPRITRVGAVLRKLRLDELPQFFNVLFGEMAFVGPRPERPFFVKQLCEQIPYYDLRHSVRPGITGWAQVCASYGATIEESKDKLEYDLFYTKNTSISLDVLILFQTIKIMLFGRGAR
jgi:sugar transferase (PEP-CTERM system associated)